VRIVCANTQTAAIGRAQAALVSATGGTAKLQEARRTLKLSWRYVKAFETESAQLYAQAMYLDEMRLRSTVGRRRGGDSATSAAIAATEPRSSSCGPTIAPIAGTRWAAYNAVSEYVDHLDGAFVYEIS
jgi:hypothetical protein